MNVRALLACVAALAMCACDGETAEPDAGRDAGSTPDSGPGGDDAGGGGDAGMDAGGGTDAGDDAGTTGDAGTPTDGGTIGACTPAPVTIMASCPAFTACGGGSLVGAWCYTGICVEEDEIFAGAGGCTADMVELRDFMGTVTGRVEFTATNVTRETDTHVEGTIVLPPGLCSAFGNCTTVETLIASQLGADGTVTCTMRADDGCDCDITLDSMTNTADTYTTDGSGGLTVGTGAGARTYDYCIDTSDGSLRFRETTAGMGAEPGLQSLAPES